MTPPPAVPLEHQYRLPARLPAQLAFKNQGRLHYVVAPKLALIVQHPVPPRLSPPNQQSFANLIDGLPKGQGGSKDKSENLRAGVEEEEETSPTLLTSTALHFHNPQMT